MTAWELLRKLSEIYCFYSIEKPCQKATNSELRRWLQNKAVQLNGKTPTWDEEVEFPITSLILFPKSENRRNTLW